MPLLCVEREVAEDDATLAKVLDVQLLVESFKYNCLNDSRIELVKHVTRIALERQRAIVLGQATLDAKDFTHEVYNTIIDEEHDHHRVLVSRSLVQIFGPIYFIIDRIVDATAGDKRLQLGQQQVNSIGSCHKTIIW